MKWEQFRANALNSQLSTKLMNLHRALLMPLNATCNNPMGNSVPDARDVMLICNFTTPKYTHKIYPSIIYRLLHIVYFVIMWNILLLTSCANNWQFISIITHTPTQRQLFKMIIKLNSSTVYWHSFSIL